MRKPVGEFLRDELTEPIYSVLDVLLMMIRTVVVMLAMAMWLTLSTQAHAQTWPAPVIKFAYQTPSSPLDSVMYATPELAIAALNAAWPAYNSGCAFIRYEGPYSFGAIALHQRNVDAGTCSIGPGSPGGHSVYEIPTCNVGWTYDAGENVCKNNTCTTQGGKVFDYDFAANGTATLPNGTSFCQDGCKATVVSGSTDSVELVGVGYTRSYYRGTARLDNAACNPDWITGTRTGNFRAEISQPSGNGSPATGVTGGRGQADGQAANTARIATNTAGILDQLRAGITVGGGGPGGGGSAPTATTESGCGRPGQPDCAVTLNEGTTGASGTAAGATAAANLAAMGGTMDATKDALKMANAPQFTAGDGSGRWTLSLAAFLGPAEVTECNLSFSVNLAGAPRIAGYDFCGIAEWVRAILYWAVAIFTMVAIWDTIYRVNN